MTNTESEKQELQPQKTESISQPTPETSPPEVRRNRISNIDKEIRQFNYKATSHEEIQELQNQREVEYQNKMKDFSELNISTESKELIRAKMVDEVIGFAQQDNKKFNELQEEKLQLKKIDFADSLISDQGGIIDHRTDSYKNFNPNKFERFLIHKGNYLGKDVIFKVGEFSRDEETVKTESRNLKLIENATAKNEQSLDVHFVKQIGDLFENEQMIGLATEYLQDDQELKNSLSVQQKTEIISRVIKNLQKLNVTSEAIESGLPSHDGNKMAGESKFWAQKLVTEGTLDRNTAKELADIFNKHSSGLNSDELFFCHGDCHGDNIFLNKNSSGELETSLIDFEGLRISNKYHDWCEILNKSEFLRSLAHNQPDIYGKMQEAVERAWLDPSIQFNEDEIMDNLTSDDSVKKINFRLTKIYDMLSRMMTSKKSNPLEQERTNLYKNLIKSELQKIKEMETRNITDSKIESSRIYEPSPAIINEISKTKVIFEKQITADTKICLIGDGQGMDTDQFFKMGISPDNIQSINYEQNEIDQANQGILKNSGIEMKRADATNFESLKNAGVNENSQEIVTLMHVLEVPNIRGATEKNLVENIAKILKPNGELLVSQYKHKFTKEERDLQKQIGIEEITAENLQKQFGNNWKENFKNEYGIDWEEGMRYGEISNIRTKDELMILFRSYFDVKLEETESEYILKMKKKQNQ